MRVCHCTLPYFNPKACEKCSNSPDIYEKISEYDSKYQDKLISEKINIKEERME